MTHNTINQAMTGHVLIAGSSGTGKSYFAGGLFELLHKQKTPYVILDTKSQNHLGIWIGKNRLKGLQLFRIFPDTNHTIEEYKKLLKKTPFLLCIPAGETDFDHLINEYKKILKAVQNLRQPRHVILEEAHHYCTSPQKAIPDMEWIAREGRGYKIWLWAITQRIQSFPKDVWSNCMWTYAFHMRIPQDIKYLSALIPNFETLNQDLQKYDVLLYSHLHEFTPPYVAIRAGEIKRRTQHLG